VAADFTSRRQAAAARTTPARPRARRSPGG
jgi:hypothetical protein